LVFPRVPTNLDGELPSPGEADGLSMSGLVSVLEEGALSSSDNLVDIVYTTDGGFALVITTSFAVTGVQNLLLVKTDMNGLVQWSKTYELPDSLDIDDNIAEALIQTSDEGFVIVGRTQQRPNHHLWFLKTDADGNVEWAKTFWGSVRDKTIYGYDAVDEVSGIVQTPDGDYLLTLACWDKYPRNDQFLIKIDSEGTLVERSPKLPESQLRYPSFVSVQTRDGGVALAGSTEEDGNDHDVLLVKTDSNGKVDWSRTIDRAGDEYPRSLVPTADGGFALSGFYRIPETSIDLWFLMKTDSQGAMTWWQTYPKSSFDDSITLVQTTDGGFVFVVINGEVEESGFVSLIKTNDNGDMLWNQTYSDLPSHGGANRLLVQTADRGLVLAGTTQEDVFLLKVAEDGTEEWRRIIDGNHGEEWATDLIQTTDGDFVLTGYLNSQAGLMKTDGNGVMVWNHTYGRSKGDMTKAVIQTADDGFVIVGATSSQGTGNTDAWLLKTDENGGVEWNRTYGGVEDDGAEAIIQTADGFALAGFTRSYGAGNSDAWLVKTDKNSTVEWNHSYGGELDDTALHLYQLANGSFALLGYYGQHYENGSCGTGGCWHADTFDDAWLLIIDENGLVQKEFIYELPGQVRFHALSWSPEEGLRIGGTSSSQLEPETGWDIPAGQDAMFVLRMNESGLYQWNKTLPPLHGTLSVPTEYLDIEYYLWPKVPLVDLVFTPDGGFILSGQFDLGNQPGFGHQFGFGHLLLKMDANGVTQWMVNSTVEITGDSIIIQLADGGYTLAGGVVSEGSNGDTVDVWLARIDANGTMLWEQTYGTLGGQPHHYVWEGEAYTASASFSFWFLIVAILIVVTGIRPDKRAWRNPKKEKK
jgi:hypothetical protein